MDAKSPGRNVRRKPSTSPARAGRARRARSHPLRSVFGVVIDAIILVPLSHVLMWSTKKCSIKPQKYLSVIRGGVRVGLLWRYSSFSRSLAQSAFNEGGERSGETSLKAHACFE